MIDCDYCDEQIDCESKSDQEILTHLAKEHGADLGPIDTKRVNRQWESDLEDELETNTGYSAITLGVSATFLSFFVGVAFALLIGL